jgi:hypothetical protein
VSYKASLCRRGADPPKNSSGTSDPAKQGDLHGCEDLLPQLLSIIRAEVFAGEGKDESTSWLAGRRRLRVARDLARWAPIVVARSFVGPTRRRIQLTRAAVHSRSTVLRLAHDIHYRTSAGSEITVQRGGLNRRCS